MIEIEVTEHPRWVAESLRRIAPFEQKITSHPYFEEMAAGILSLKRFQSGLINFYPLIASFPKYMELTLTKLQEEKSDAAKKSRQWFLDNISIERRHAEWWKDWAEGFGVPRSRLEDEVFSLPEIEALNNYLWHICTDASIVEAVAAVNFAVEGPTGVWARNVRRGLGREPIKE